MKQKQIKSTKIKESGSDRVYNIITLAFIWIILLVILLPLLNIVSSSFSDPTAVIAGEVTFWPIRPTLIAYEAVFQSDSLISGFLNSVFYTLVGTIVNLTMVIAFAYPLSRKDFVGRRVLMLIVTFTMYFSGGLIPTYLVVSGFNMVNTVWALVIPGCVSAYFVIIARTFFMTNIPDELTEAANIDGSSDLRTLISIVLPNSKAILAVMTLVLREILIENSSDAQMLNAIDVEDQQELKYLAELLKYSTIVISSIPMLIAYPFAQKHFVKGVMIGSVKG